MKIKRYFAEDVKHALQQVRDELGADAAIISNRSVSGGVEIMVAIDYDKSILDEPKSPAAKPEILVEKASTTLPVEWLNDPVILGLKQDISVVRNLLEHQMTGLAWSDYKRQNPLKACSLQALSRIGFCPKICESIVEQIGSWDHDETTWQQIKQVLMDRLPVQCDEIVQQGGVISLLGATGVGKTTTIAKIAARFLESHSIEDIGLISTDFYRIGAHEQLRSYAAIFGVTIKLVEDVPSFVQALQRFRDKKLILIDCPGMGINDTRVPDHMKILKSAGRDVKNYVVIPASYQKGTIIETIKTYREFNINGSIITKIDEATSLGEILSAIIYYQLPIVYLTNGQHIPDDLLLPQPNHIISLAEKLVDCYQPETIDQSLAYALFNKGDTHVVS